MQHRGGQCARTVLKLSGFYHRVSSMQMNWLTVGSAEGEAVDGHIHQKTENGNGDHHT
jgi:hypothetical protein